jgi:hypothetical protein
MTPGIQRHANMSQLLDNTPKSFVRTLVLFYLVVKGLVGSVLLFGSFPYYFYYYNVTGIEYQMYTTLGLLPWGCKSVIGLLTDNHPIRGYHKRWYAYIAAVALPLWLVGIAASDNPDVMAVMMTGASTSIMTLDALIEGQYMSNVRFRNADKGTASFTWQCIMAGSMIGPVIIGLCSSGPEDVANIRYAFVATIFLSLPFSFMVLRYPANVFNDDAVVTDLNKSILRDDDEDARTTHGFTNGGMIQTTRGPNNGEKALAFLLFAGSIVMFITLFMNINPVIPFTGALVFSILLVLMLEGVYADHEGLRHTCIFGFLNEALHLNISGAMDSYYTSQNDNCVMNGPGFDFIFYITVAAIVGGFVGVIVSYTYRRHILHRFEVRSTVVTSIIAWGCTSVVDIIIVKRWNITVLGIPDWLMFLLGDVVFSQAMSMSVLLPLMSLTSTAVIRGVATLTSMNTLSCQNIGSSVGRVFGIYLTYILGVHSTEERGCNFDNLVALIVVARIIIPLLAVPLCYFFLPNAVLRQNTKTA